MKAKKGFDQTILAVAVLGSLVFLNILSQRYFARLDLTHDRRFTLSGATTETLESLDDPITVRAYFTTDLPPPFSTNARYTRDLLDEYRAASNGQLRFEFVDPVSGETDEDRKTKKDVKRDIFGRSVREQTSVEQEMQQIGIPPVQVQVNEDDKVEVKRAYMGLAVHHGDKSDVIPMIQETSGLEYDLTTLIRKMTREKTPKIAILGGHGEPKPEELSQAWGLMTQLYDVTQLDLKEKPEIPADVDAILVIGPTTPFGEEEKKALDKFITSGKSVAFLLDATHPDFQTLTAGEANHGLSDLLESYGVKIEPGLVIDAEAATINVGQQRGAMRIMQPVRYPLIPEPKKLDSKHPLTRGLSQVAFPFMSPLEVTVPQGSDLKAEVLVRSSDKSWVQKPPFDLNPMQRWTADASDQPKPRNLVVALSGPIPSHYPEGAGGEKKPGRVVVIGGSAFITNQFLAPGNQALVLNLLDWLVLDDALLAVRARGLEAAPLEELDLRQKTVIRYANVIGIPLAAVLFGIGRWRWRERRRSRVHL